MGFSVTGFAALVRLNPNIPYKTRGNGAVVFSVNEGDPRDRKVVFKELIGLIERESRRKDENTNPGLVVTDDHFGIHHYVRTIREVHDIGEIKEVLSRKTNTMFRSFGNGRGLIGCVGALSWFGNFRDKAMDHTYELISYRKPEYRKRTRLVDKERVILLDRELGNTFNNYDHANDKALIYPNSPCPVLFGVRGEEPGELERVLDILDCREMERWQIFVTNQGTDDHLVPRKLIEIENYTSVIAEGTVMDTPWVIRGGHVFFHVTDNGHSILASAFEPTKGFRNIVKALLPGDRIRLFGGVKGEEKNVSHDPYNEQPTFENVGFTRRELAPKGAGASLMHRSRAGILGNIRRSIHPPFKNGGTRREFTPEGAGDLKSHRSEAVILLFPADKRTGAAGEFSKCINIEKMEVISLVADQIKTHNPSCPECGRRMKSTGKGKGYRCRSCHVKVSEEEAGYRTVHRELEVGKIYEVDGVARRHLSKPLKRMGIEKGVNLGEMVLTN